MTEADSLVTRDEVARRVGCSVRTLSNLEARGTGPRITRIGRLVRYDRRDVDAWLEQQKVGTR